MKKIEMTETILTAKNASVLGWEEIAAQTGLAQRLSPLQTSKDGLFQE